MVKNSRSYFYGYAAKPFAVKALRFFLNKILKFALVVLKSKYG
jgi:hypothetical protein